MAAKKQARKNPLVEQLKRRRRIRRRLNAGQEYMGWAHLIPLQPLFPEVKQ